MELRQLQVFVEVVDAGSFKGAANRLHVTQPAVSYSIRALESRLGVGLFVRGQHSIRLTAAGESLLPRARSILRQVELAARDVLLSGNGEVLRVGCFASVGLDFFPSVARRFSERFPGVHIEVSEGTDLELVAGLRAGDIDVSFVLGEPRGVATTFLYCDDFVYVARTLNQIQGSCIDLQSLSGMRRVRSMGGCEAVIARALELHGIVSSTPAQVREASTALSIVAAGIANAILPRALVSGAHRDVVCADMRPNITRQVGIAVREDGTSGLLAASFARLALEMAKQCGARMSQLGS